LIDEWDGGAMSKLDQIRVIEHKIEKIAEKQQKLDAIKTYLITKLSKLKKDRA
jgi:hypothetical protein